MKERKQYTDLWKAQQVKAWLHDQFPGREYVIQQLPNGKFIVRRKWKPSLTHPWRDQ